MHRNHPFLIITLILVVLLFVACGGDEEAPAEDTKTTQSDVAAIDNMDGDSTESAEDPTPEPQPTDTPEPTKTPEPTPTPEPTATPDPAANYETFEDVAAGIRFLYPPEWVLDPESGDGFYIFANDEAMFVADEFDEGLGTYVVVSSAEEAGVDLNDLTGWTDDSIVNDFEGEPIEAATLFDMPDLQAARATFSADVDGAGENEHIVIYILTDGEQLVSLMGITSPAAAASWMDILDTIARSIVLTGAADDVDSASTLTAAGEAVSGPGMACLGTQGLGMSCIDADGSWQTYTTDNSSLGGDYITALSTCADGRLVIAHTSGLSLFDGAEWGELDAGWGFATPTGVACDADGVIWVAHFEGVSRYDGSEWTTFASDLLSSGESATDLVEDVVIAPDGTVWVATANSVAAYDGSDWTVYQGGQGFDDQLFIDAIALDSTGLPWIAQGDGLLQFDGSQWIVHEHPSFLVANALAFAPNDAALVGTFGDGIEVFDGNWQSVSLDNSDLSIERVQAIAFDDTGRAWIGTTWGLNVVDADNNWTIYRLDNADMVDHNIATVAVLGDGPAVLPQPVDKGTGRMIGRVELDGAASADSRVEICVQPLYSSFRGDTPCSDQPLFFQTVTDADGAFAFNDVPEGFYIIVFETDDGWAQITTEFGLGSERVPIIAGEELDIGTITLDEE
ncbi:MAG: hypothetical protein M9928_08945 [Anaerolineae bacterium]|nr:hypothetical protein [Anaerolineae bacterium]